MIINLQLLVKFFEKLHRGAFAMYQDSCVCVTQDWVDMGRKMEPVNLGIIRVAFDGLWWILICSGGFGSAGLWMVLMCSWVLVDSNLFWLVLVGFGRFLSFELRSGGLRWLLECIDGLCYILMRLKGEN